MHLKSGQRKNLNNYQEWREQLKQIKYLTFKREEYENAAILRLLTILKQGS